MDSGLFTTIQDVKKTKESVEKAIQRLLELMYLIVLAGIISLFVFSLNVIVLALQGSFEYYSTKWINQKVIAKTFYVTTYLKPITHLITAVSLFIGLDAGVYFSIRHAMKISLVKVTRLRFRT